VPAASLDRASRASQPSMRSAATWIPSPSRPSCPRPGPPRPYAQGRLPTPGAIVGVCGRGRYTRGMELLEREHFLGTLRDCPPGHVALVAGEAGIGKTVLVREF
jgi:hypothetical protein